MNIQFWPLPNLILTYLISFQVTVMFLLFMLFVVVVVVSAAAALAADKTAV
jgi:cell division protein FtsL